MAFDTVTHSKKRNLIVHDAIGYVYLLGLNQVGTSFNHKNFNHIGKLFN